MALQFQAPNLPVPQDKYGALNETLGKTLQTLPQLYAAYKIERMKQDLEQKKLQAALKEAESKYGTGEQAPSVQPSPSSPLNLVPNGPGSALPGGGQASETPEEQLRRLGSEGYKALHEPEYYLVGPNGETTPLPKGAKPFAAPQQVQYVIPQTDAAGNIVGMTQLAPGVRPGPMASPKPENAGFSPAEKAVDANFGKEYSDYVAGGGYTETQRRINQLDSVIKDLEGGSLKTGAVRGLAAKLPFTDARAAKENVDQVVQSNLRQVLGAQYTEKEGTGLLSRTFNPSQPTAENMRRLKNLLTQIRGAAEAKQRAAEYFEQNGTLKGFNGALYLSMNQFDPSRDTAAPANQAGGVPDVGGTFKGAKVLKVTKVK
jgi:hypothetical protein